MKTFIGVIIQLAILWHASANYCSLRTCSAQTHTACKFSIKNVGPRCSPADKFRTRLPTAGEQTEILRLHNEFRRRVAKGFENRGKPGPQPPAANMRRLTWDNEIASIAQIHAQQCAFVHDTCRNTAKYPVGQNIYVRMSTAPITSYDWANAIRSWTNEVTAYNRNWLQSFKTVAGVVIGHYTQVVWAATRSVGCGVSTYKDTSFNPGFPYKQLYVCNYGPSGNYIGQSVYRHGTAGSACPAGTRNYDGLCG